MLDCLILGDSIAVGTGQHIPKCATVAKVGASSAAIIGYARPANVAIISAGSNDPHNPRLEQNLRVIRSKVQGRAIWIAPANQTAASIVNKVARFYGDHVVTFVHGRDGVHPKSYGVLAASVRPLLLP